MHKKIVRSLGMVNDCSYLYSNYRVDKQLGPIHNLGKEATLAKINRCALYYSP